MVVALVVFSDLFVIFRLRGSVGKVGVDPASKRSFCGVDDGFLLYGS